MYEDQGLHLEPANNAVEAGIYIVWQAFVSGQLKVFNNLTNLLREFRLYRRDDKGKVHKSDDHLMDAMRYLMVSGRDSMKTKLDDQAVIHEPAQYVDPTRTESWMG
jgi:Terminase RNaseH-like domain